MALLLDLESDYGSTSTAKKSGHLMLNLYLKFKLIVVMQYMREHNGAIQVRAELYAVIHIMHV